MFKKWMLAASVILLANLPDIDVLIGLVFYGNGDAIHRGPTHSLLFALVAGYIFSLAAKKISWMPVISFRNSFLIILSHLLSDLFFTSSPVSFLYPLENLVTDGFSGWGDIAASVAYDNVRDVGVIAGCISLIAINLFVRYAFRVGGIKMRESSR